MSGFPRIACWGAALLALSLPCQAAEIYLTLLPEAEGQRFGAQVAPLGDVNADSHDDFLVLAPAASGTGYTGRAYVYFGGPAADEQPDLVLQVGPSGGLSDVLAGPFDFNGDGHSDIAISSENYDDGENIDAGAVFVYYGGPDLDDVPDVTLFGDWTRRYFGHSLARAGKFSVGDECDDLAVSINPLYGFGPLPTVYVFFGGPEPSTTPDWGRVYYDYFDYFARTMAYAGDYDGDGYGNFLAGAPWADGLCFDPLTLEIDPECPRTGAVLVYYGGPDMLRMEKSLITYTEGTLTGSDLDGAFDVNGDGYDDVIATAPGVKEARIWFGQPDWPSAAGSNLTLTPGGDVAGLGDVNGDGFADVAVADTADVVKIFFGGAQPDTLCDLQLQPEPGEQWDILQVTRAGDIDGDGLGDLLLHFRQMLTWNTGLDRVRVYRNLVGRPTPVFLAQFVAVRDGDRAVVRWTIQGTPAGESFQVWREEPSSPRVCLTSAPLTGLAAYEFPDPHPPWGTASYWLQVKSVGEADTWWGPAALAAAPLPARPLLAPNVPNPFNPRTTLRFALPRAGWIRLSIHDVAGRLVRELVNGQCEAGSHTAVWDGCDARGRQLPAGSYLARLEADGGTVTGWMSLVR